LILNLNEVTFDSSGLGEIVSAYTQLSNRHECRMVLCSPNQQNLKILEITGLSRVFEIYDSEEEAVKACKDDLK
jgi:anti-anti-sigma factor